MPPADTPSPAPAPTSALPTRIAADDGVALQLRHWPAPAPARGTVLIVHGLGEHIGRYAHVAACLHAAGWHVAGHDQRGHGASDGPRGQIVAGDDLLRDLACVIDAVRVALPGPLVLLGHSMGGLVAARFAAEGVAAAGARSAAPAGWQRPLDALVLSSPSLATAMTARQKVLLAVATPLAPDRAVHNGLQPEWISRDPAVVAAYVADPLVHDRIAPRLVRFIVDAAAVVHARAPHWTPPTLLLYAGSDRCVPPAGSAAFAAAAPKEVVMAREYPGLAHEIFNEPEQGQVIDALVQWLGARFPVPSYTDALPPGASPP